MSEITKDDIHRAIQDSVRDIINSLNHIRDQVERIDRRTDDLDESQREIRDLSQKIQHLYPQLEVITRGAREPDQLRLEVEDIKLRTQNIERGVQQITAYLQAQHQTEQEERGYKN